MKPTVKLAIKLALCCLSLACLAFIPRNENPLDKLVSNLQLWRDSIPQEKVYLHTDKPYYALGDTIWFKGYLTVGSRHQLSALSGAMYVELISEKDSLIEQLKLPVTSGMVMGNFILKDDYHQGSYRIRAYTQWMRNAGQEYFYDHTFTVGDVAGGDVVAKADFSYIDNKGKPVLTAILNYTHDDGKALGEKSIRYEIWADKKPLWQQNSKTDALGSLKITIPDDIKLHPEGAYVHTIVQGSDKQDVVRDFPIKASMIQSDVQFFPESGNLINGIASRVAFKALGIEGLGINIKGSIVDNDNKEIATLETLHAGMGSFSITPVAGKTYTANIQFEDGSTKNVPLPKALDQGYVLAIGQTAKDGVFVHIYASASLLQSSVNLIAHTNGETIFSTSLKIEKPVTSVWLDKKAFPTGIAAFTLFNSTGEPMNERIAFIRSNDLMQLNIKTAKAEYDSKERVKVNLEAKDSKGLPTAGNFSVSVVDENKIPFDETRESTILSNTLLTSDLKGYVEQPNYYFFKTGDEVDRALDNLMLTQGYRRFAWKALNNTVTTKPQYPVEGLGTTFTGKVTSLTHKPVPNASVMMMALRASVNKVTTADAEGNFKLPGYFVTDSMKISIQARNGKSNKVIVAIDSIPKAKINSNPNLPDVSTNITVTLKAYLDNVKQEDDAYEKLGMLDKVHRLREVKIRAKKIDPYKNYAQQWGPIIPEEMTDQTYYPKNLAEAAYLGMALQGNLRMIDFTMFKQVPMYPHKWIHGHLIAMAVLLNGRHLDPDEARAMFDGSQLEPSDVIRVDVIGATLLLYTKPESERRRYYTPSIVNFTPKGFDKVREFYSPRYGRPGNADKQPDLRTTIFWSPYLKTDSAGNTSFNFYNADGPGNYRVVIEGINAAGQLGRTVYHYRVNAVGSNLASTPVVADKNTVRITAPLDSFNKRLPVEKAYLQLDKPYYNLGDTLWFKAYVVNGANLTSSKISGLLYVELDNDSTEMVRRVSVTIKDGLAWGQIPLPPKIFREGGYTLRAYTNWMQNAGEDIFFSQRFYLGVPTQNAWLVNSNANITRAADKDQLDVELKLTRPDKYLSTVALKKVEVKIYDEYHYLYKENLQTGIDGSLKFEHQLNDKADSRRIRVQLTSLEKTDGFKQVQVPLTINRNQNIDLQFLPEGGNLVAGLNSVVGFKAIGEDGNGTAVLGAIYDSKNNLVVSFAPLHNGMGSFLFTPHAGETYTARISQPIAKTYPLPKIQSAGSLLHIYNPERGADLKVDLVATSSILTGDSCYLIGASKGIIYYSQKVDPSHLSLSVAKDLFPTGVARFTLFKGITPLNERAVFIDNADLLQISIKPNKTTYKTRDSVSLDILVQDKSGMPAQGNFSLAVTDNSQVKPDSLGNYGIASGLLLNSALKGNIESPGYYINRKDKQAWQALDNLMLTQGWTGYDWKEVFAPATPVKFKAEKDFKITGQVTDLFNKPIPNASVLISSQKPSFLTTTTADANGLYTFQKLPAIDSSSFFIQASKANGKKMQFGNVSVNKFKAPEVPETLRNPILPWYVNTDSTQLNYLKRKTELDDDLKLTGRVLKEVKIQSHKIIPESRNRNGPGGADLIFDEKDIKESGVLNLYELIKQKLPGLRVIDYHKMPTLILNDDLVVIEIDGGGLPIQLNGSPTVDELIDELSQYQIVSFKGMEVMYSENNMVRYLKPRDHWIARHFRGDEVFNSENNLISGGNSGEPWVYQPGYKPGYLDNRANVYTNKTPSIAVIGITTKNGSGYFRSITPNAITYRPLPILHPQQFYSPKYTAIKPIADKPDYRSTIFWEPNINTDINGRAKVYFYTSDIKSSYTIKISGIDFTGNIGDHIFNLNKPHETNP